RRNRVRDQAIGGFSMFIRFLAAAVFVALASTTSAFASTSIEPGLLKEVRDLGAAPPSVRVHVAVVLNSHHADELNRLLEAQANPRSPLYHRFLTAAQFHRYFGATAAENMRVIAALRRAGFTIENSAANGSIIDASAPAPEAARYFRTDIH